MELQSAQLVFYFIMSVAICVWTHSLVKALKLGKSDVPEPDPWADPPATDNEAESAETGTRTVRGDPERLSRALAHSMLHQSIPGMFAPLFELVERTTQRVVVRKTSPLICNQPAGLYFTEVEFNLVPAGGDAVEISYYVGYEQLTRKLRRVALAIILGAGLPVMIGLGAFIWFYVVQHGNPGVRYQVFQLLQVVHVLWPPFLIMHRHTAGRVHARTYISNMLISLELSNDAEPA